MLEACCSEKAGWAETTEGKAPPPGAETASERRQARLGSPRARVSSGYRGVRVSSQVSKGLSLNIEMI